MCGLGLRGCCQDLLGGSWLVISGVISPLIRAITILTLLKTPLISTPEPPSGALFKMLFVTVLLEGAGDLVSRLSVELQVP